MLKNENGSSLLIVLMTMTVFSVVGLGLLGLNINSAKQTSVSGGNMQATNLAEMGTLHLEQEIYKLLGENNNVSLEQLATILQTGLPNNNDYKVKSDTGTQYKLQRDESVNYDSDEEQVIITFDSIGIAGNDREKSVSGSMIVMQNFPLVPAGVDPVTGVQYYKMSGKDNEVEFDETMYYYDGFGLHSNTLVTYDIDLYSQGDVTINSNSDVWVKGDAYVSSFDLKTNNPNNGNQALMCVENTLTIYGPVPADTVIEELSTIGKTCEEIIDNNDHQSGVYAKEIIYEGSSWKLVREAEYN